MSATATALTCAVTRARIGNGNDQNAAPTAIGNPCGVFIDGTDAEYFPIRLAEFANLLPKLNITGLDQAVLARHVRMFLCANMCTGIAEGHYRFMSSPCCDSMTHLYNDLLQARVLHGTHPITLKNAWLQIAASSADNSKCEWLFTATAVTCADTTTTARAATDSHHTRILGEFVKHEMGDLINDSTWSVSHSHGSVYSLVYLLLVSLSLTPTTASLSRITIPLLYIGVQDGVLVSNRLWGNVDPARGWKQGSLRLPQCRLGLEEIR